LIIRVGNLVFGWSPGVKLRRRRRYGYESDATHPIYNFEINYKSDGVPSNSHFLLEL